MKKFASIVASAALIGGGLVAAAPASAAPTGGCGDYPSCVPTATNANAINNPKAGRAAKVSAKVVANSNRTPRGLLRFNYTRKGSGNSVAVFNRDYDGGRDQYAFSGLPKGRYTVKVVFKGDGRFKDSRTNFSQRVRPNR